MSRKCPFFVQKTGFFFAKSIKKRFLHVAFVDKGSGGFGYDPIFYVPEFGCTTAELSAEQKNSVSHRGRALEEMKEQLIKLME